MTYQLASRIFVASLGAALGLTWACGGENSGGASPSQPVTNNDMATALSSAFCEGIVGCCSRYGYPSDTAACKNTLQTLLSAQMTTLFGTGHYTYDANAAGACVAAYRNAAEACTSHEAEGAVETACQKVYMGNVALGGSCSASGECVQNETRSVTCNAGVCALPTDNTFSYGQRAHGKLGEACQSTCISYGNGGSSCGGSASASTAAADCWANEGLVCGAGSICVAAPAVGESCSGYCAPGAYCSGATCVAQDAAGSCKSASDACLSTSYCDSTTDMCTPKKADGATCNSDSECTGGDCLGDHCRVWAIATPSSCAGLTID